MSQLQLLQAGKALTQGLQAQKEPAGDGVRKDPLL